MSPSGQKYLQATAYLMLAFIFVIVIGITKNCSNMHSGAIEGHSRGDTLDIAMIYGPGSYYAYPDTMGGINLELAQEFQSATGLPVKIWPITEPSYGKNKVEDGTYDILASLPLDNSIKKNFQVSESVFLDRLVLVQLADSAGNEPVKSSLDLNGKTVAVTAGSSAANRMKNLADEIGGDITIEEVPEISDELLTLQVANGTIPLAIVNERIAKDIARHYPDLKFENSVSFTQFQVWLFNPNDSVISNKFNQWFEEFRNTENYKNIVNKY